jgi:hypothetical protein
LSPAARAATPTSSSCTSTAASRTAWWCAICRSVRAPPDSCLLLRLRRSAAAPPRVSLTRRGVRRADRVLWADELRGAARHQGYGAGHRVRSVPAPHPRGALHHAPLSCLWLLRLQQRMRARVVC